jgi:hypothetical protein
VDKQVEKASATITDCSFTGNRAVGGEGGAEGGGAINNGQFGTGTVNVSNCTFTANQAIGGDGGVNSSPNAYGFGSGGGGAIRNTNDVLNVSHCLFIANQTFGGSGGSLVTGSRP